MRSCSMDIGGITPEYVQRAWGGRVAIEDIEAAFEELKRSDDLLEIGLTENSVVIIVLATI